MKTMGRDTLADRVAEGLLSSVMRGSFRTGHQLPSEADIAFDFGVSRSVVREAISHLRAMGVIEVSNGKKAVVKLLDPVPLARFFNLAAAQEPNNLIQLLEVRCGIESESAFLAAQRRTSEDLAVISGLLEQIRGLVLNQRTFDVASYAELDRDLHIEIARASKNFLLEQLALSIREPMKESILEGLGRQGSLGQRRRVHKTHMQIVHAIKRGDAEGAQLAMRSHIMGATLLVMFPQSAAMPREKGTHRRP